MTDEVVTVSSDAYLSEASKRMVEENIGCLVVLPEDEAAPAGILTETDVLRRALPTDKPLSRIPVQGASTSPLTTVEPERTVRYAVEKMLDEGVKRLPVIDGDDLELTGIVTITDIALRYDDIRSDAVDMVQKPDMFRGE